MRKPVISKTTEVLIENGLKQEYINYAMYQAIRLNLKDMFNMLIDHIDINQTVIINIDSFNSEDIEELSLMYQAIDNGEEYYIKKLLYLKPDCKLIDGEGKDMIDHALNCEDEKLREILLEYINSNTSNNRGEQNESI